MHAQANVMLNTIVIGNMYLLHKQDGSHTIVVKRETLKAAVDSMNAFAETHDLEIVMNPETMHPEATDGTRFPETKAWIELEPYKQIEL
jgi:fibrillarin-like rRNA methylase